ncbi:hypothetical protein QE449_000059 [Rhodococcus sp. SORGH_AS303]|nr:hypothetical protein [Rhodococcus sp. SORGH_AS_0303]
MGCCSERWEPRPPTARARRPRSPRARRPTPRRPQHPHPTLRHPTPVRRARRLRLRRRVHRLRPRVRQPRPRVLRPRPRVLRLRPRVLRPRLLRVRMLRLRPRVLPLRLLRVRMLRLRPRAPRPRLRVHRLPPRARRLRLRPVAVLTVARRAPAMVVRPVTGLQVRVRAQRRALRRPRVLPHRPSARPPHPDHLAWCRHALSAPRARVPAPCTPFSWLKWVFTCRKGCASPGAQPVRPNRGLLPPLCGGDRPRSPPSFDPHGFQRHAPRPTGRSGCSPAGRCAHRRCPTHPPESWPPSRGPRVRYQRRTRTGPSAVHPAVDVHLQ